MIRTRLIVEGYNVDLLEDVDSEFTYNIADLREPDKRKTDFSKTISLPGTARNNSLFGNIWSVEVENDLVPGAPNIGYSFNPSKAAKASLFVDNIEVFRGVLQITKITESKGSITYESNMFGRLTDIIMALGEKKLSDIDFSDLNEPLHPDNIKAVWDAEAINIVPAYQYAYPLIDYGISQDNYHYPITNFMPAIYARQYIRRMFAAAGFTYNSDFIDSQYFRRLIIPFSKKEVVGQSASATLYLEATPFQPQTFTNSSNPSYVDYKIGALAITNSSYMSFDPVQDRINILVDLETSFRFVFEFVYYSNPTANPGAIKIMKNGSVLKQVSIVHNPVGQFVTIELEKQDFSAGDYLECFASVRSYAQITFYGGTDALWRSPSPADMGTYPIGLGDMIDFNQVTPPTLQREFFKSILLMHNLLMFTDPDDEKNVFIVPDIWFYSPMAADAVDWTDKVDHSKPIQTIPMGELSGREYLLTYKTDTDYWNDLYQKNYGEPYGLHRLTVDNDFEKDSKKIEVVFSPTPLVQMVESGTVPTSRMCPAIYKQDNDGTKKRDGFNIRILYNGFQKYSYLAGTNTLRGFLFVDELGNTIPGWNVAIARYCYAGHLDDPANPTLDINFGVPRQVYFPTSTYPANNLYYNWWKPYLDQITDRHSKLLQMSVRLLPTDISQLDFKRLVKIDNRYFKLNKVSGYNPTADDVTSVELFKTNIEIDYDEPGYLLHEDGDANGINHDSSLSISGNRIMHS